MQELDLARLKMGVKIENESAKPSSKLIWIDGVLNHCSAVAKSNFVQIRWDESGLDVKSRFVECIESRNESLESISE